MRRALTRFIQTEVAGGAVLVVATVAALAWANSPWQEDYADVWTTSMSVSGERLPQDVRHWVNDGLMALFFFVVALEIRRELVAGQLSSRREATLPAIAALGGMILPALLYAAVNVGGDGVDGWGIPMATDIAFAVGVLALLGDRVPPALKVLVLALAIVDDLGAIVVIAAFYTDELSAGWLTAAGGGVVAVGLLRKVGVSFLPIYAAIGVGVWVATFESGIHATLAGVALAVVVPVATSERLEAVLHPWTSLVVVPLFALANAGVVLSTDAISDAAGSAVTTGVVLGLVVGKPVGIGVAVWLAVRFGWGRLPAGVGWMDVAGMAAIAGIGFTVSLFVSGLAFDDPALAEQATIGVLAGSVLAAVAGVLLLRPRWHERRARPDTDVR